MIRNHGHEFARHPSKDDPAVGRLPNYPRELPAPAEEEPAQLAKGSNASSTVKTHLNAKYIEVQPSWVHATMTRNGFESKVHTTLETRGIRVSYQTIRLSYAPLLFNVSRLGVAPSVRLWSGNKENHTKEMKPKVADLVVEDSAGEPVPPCQHERGVHEPGRPILRRKAVLLSNTRYPRATIHRIGC